MEELWAFLRAFVHAGRGVVHGWRTQRNFRVEVACAALALSFALWLRAPLSPILLACALVLSLELLNSALEAALDRLHPERHPGIGAAKDAAAGAVLLASAFALLVAGVELLPRLIARLVG